MLLKSRRRVPVEECCSSSVSSFSPTVVRGGLVDGSTVCGSCFRSDVQRSDLDPACEIAPLRTRAKQLSFVSASNVSS